MSIRRLTPADVESYRDIRLEGLRLNPEAFGSSYEEERDRAAEEFVGRCRLGQTALDAAWHAAQ